MEEVRDTALLHARRVNPDCRVVALSINTQALDESAAQDCLKEAEDRMGLPATDPYRFGAGKLVDALDGL